MQDDHARQLDEAAATMERTRDVTVSFRVRWRQFDDLDPAAEGALRDALIAIFQAWESQHCPGQDITVPSPRISVEKPFTREMLGMIATANV